MVREYTNKLRDALEESIISKDMVIDMCLAYMSEDDVKDMCRANDVLLEDLEEEDEDELEDEDVVMYLVYGDYGLETQTLLYESTLYSEAADFFKGYTDDVYDLGGYDTVELGYFLEDGEWVDTLRIEKAEEEDDA